MTEFSIRLKLVRAEKDVTLQEVANQIDSTKSAMSRYEGALVEPNLNTFMRLAEYFNVTLDWLAGVGPRLPIQHKNTTPPEVSKLQEIAKILQK